MPNRFTARGFTLGGMLAAAIWAPHTARADAPDYGRSDTEWNGLGRLVALAPGAAVNVEWVDDLDVDRLGPTDALLIVYPTRPLPVSSLTRWIDTGGRLALADDFGLGDGLLHAFGIQRHRPDLRDAATFADHPSLPLAAAALTHPIVEGVPALVTNHPAALRHPRLHPIASFGRDEDALVLSGQVGEGRFLAIADPSVLINHMLALEPNRRFAENLLRYLGSQGGSVYVAVGDATLHGRADPPPPEAWLDRMQRWLERFAHADLPPLAWLLLAFTVAAVALVVAGAALPLWSPYPGSIPRGLPGADGGLLGRVRFFARSSGQLAYPALRWKQEVDGAIETALGLRRRASWVEVERALAQRGVPAKEIANVRAALIDLSELRARVEGGGDPPSVSASRLRRWVSTLEGALDALRGFGEDRSAGEQRTNAPPRTGDATHE